MAPAVFSSASSSYTSGTSPLSSPGATTPIEQSSDYAPSFDGLRVEPPNGDGSDSNLSDDASREGNGANSRTMPKTMPIAIVGMACRLPGNVASPTEFWELCSRARSGYSGVPKDRFNHEAFFHPNPGKTGAYHAAGGYFLEGDVAAFDAPFFGLTEKEALSMDPQQRLLLECTFEALENAGIPKHSIVGKDVGVFIGGSLAEYESHLGRDSDTIPMHQATGCAHAMQSNRLSHFFDLRGPSFTADTACSSSLVALHLACQSLRLGESTQAIAGGCHLNLLPESWISFSTCRLLSDSGRSIAFDSRGSGFGRGEGCGMVILKPLSKALEDKDSIRAVIMGTGINQDGRTPGITMPNAEAQERLIKQVYRNAGLDPSDCGFVEAHGTGTKVGDPLEAKALHNALGQERTAKDPLFLGSVKSNIGHLEAASGIAAIIKATLMLERGFILPNHDFKKPNEKIPWKDWNLKIPATQRPWPKTKKYISVNNFGFGGTNAHVVLGKAPFIAKAPPKASSKQPSSKKSDQAGRKLFIISANDKHSLAAVMKNLVVYLEQRPEIFQLDLLNNLAYTLGQRRSLLQWKVAIPAVTSFDLIDTLNAEKVIPCKELDSLRIGFVFTGQGAQWYGMGRELFDQYPVYKAAITRADQCLRRLGAKWSLVEELSRDAENSNVSAAHISQPSCTAVQLALTDLLRTWGVKPFAVAGHSSGEIGAAYAAGIISFETAMSVAYHRGRLIPILKEKFPTLDGIMMAVGATKEEVQPMIDGLKAQQARIACYNSPSSLTISGDASAVDELEEVIRATQPDMFRRKLLVDVAYHSHHMNLVAKEYNESIHKLPAPKHNSSVRFHSSLYGHRIEGTECGPNYWVNNLTCPVRFSEALETMLEPVGEHKIGVNMIIELGPHSALQGPIRQILKSVGAGAEKLPYNSLLVRKKDAVESSMEVAASLITKGARLKLEAINFPNPTKTTLLTDLPRYSWNYQNSYWKESRLSYMHRNRTSARNDLIGLEAIYSTPYEPTWRNIVNLDDLPWLRHHQVQGVTVFPISGFITMAVEAAGQLAQRHQTPYDKFELKGVSVIKPLALTDSDVEMTITLKLDRESRGAKHSSSFRICTWSQATGWTEHCIGHISTVAIDDQDIDIEKRKINMLRQVETISSATEGSEGSIINESNLYDSLSDLGVVYGPSFQGMTKCKASNKYAAATIAVADIQQHMPNNYMTDAILHPTLLESIVELYWPVLSIDESTNGTIYLPSSVGSMTISKDITSLIGQSEFGLQAYCEADFTGSGTTPQPTKVAMFATALEGAKDVLIQIDDLTVSPILNGEIEPLINQPRELCYKLDWEPILESETQANLPVLSQNLNIAIVHGESGFQQIVANALAIALNMATSKLPDMGSVHDIDPTGKICIVLTEIEEPFLANATKEQFATMQRMFLASQGVLWIARGAYDNSTSPESNMIAGMSRTIRSETLLPFAILDLDGKNILNEDATSKAILDIFHLAFGSGSSPSSELEFMERSGKFFTSRVINDDEMNVHVHRMTNPSALELQPFSLESRHLKMELSARRTFETLHFVDDELVSTPLADSEIEFEVKAIGMNKQDVTLLLKSPTSTGDNYAPGLEASGIVTRVGSTVTSFSIGQRIAALTISHGAYGTLARTSSSMAFAIPDSFSFHEAAASPLAYCTAYYGLVERARLRAGNRILVHSASNPIAQAAISIAKNLQAEIYVTAGSAEEKTLLTVEHGIPETNVFYSGSTTFGAAIRECTGGRGVDVVLNLSANADTLRESWACLSRFGSLVDVASRSGASNGAQLITSQANDNASYVGVDILGLAVERPEVMQNVVADVAQLLHDGRAPPITSLTEFPISDVQAALKLLQSDQAPGKFVTVPHADDMVMATRSTVVKQFLRADRTYVLIGGTGGLGRSMAKWMITHGAKTILLLSRSGSVTGKVKELIEVSGTIGANIVVRSCNIADRKSVDELFTSGLSGLPPVGGVVHGAMVLRDILFEKMAWEDYTTVIESKVQGAWNIHHALQDHNIPIDFFIAISSASGIVGNRGQAAYAAANTFLNAFVQHRLVQGLPAVSLDLTAVSDVGYLADMGADRAAEVARNLGSDSICEAEVLALLGAAITGRTAGCNHHVLTGMRITPTMKPFWTDDAKFKQLRLAAEALAAAEAGTNAGSLSPGAALKAARDAAEAEEVVCSGLVDKISAVLMMEPEEMDVTRSLSHYPLDSLVAIEIRNFITREFEANMQVLELLSSGSIQTLTKAVCQKSKLCASLL